MHSADTQRNLNISGAGKKSDATRLATAAIHAASMLAVLSVLLLVSPRTAHAQTETVLYNFCSIQVSGVCQDGNWPASNLTFRDGNYYGTTTYGGVGNMGFGGGTVFELAPNGSGGWQETVLYSFCSVVGGYICVDGGFPQGPVIFDSAGNIYGVTPAGGNTCELTYGCGAVFELSPVGLGWTETVLYAFCPGGSCQYGIEPGAITVMDSAGNLYLTNSSGVLQLSPSSGVWTIRLISFNTINPNVGLVDSSGNIFVLAPSPTAGQQALFEVSPNGKGGWTTTELYSFKGSGGYWSNLAMDQAGNFYGEWQGDGKTAPGTVYQLSPGTSGWTKKTLFTFDYDNSALDGFSPSGGLVLDSSGKIYGTTNQGGTYGLGTVFELVPVGLGNYEEKVFWSFNGTDGSYPSGSPILDSAGNLYGTTTQGGSTGNGVVYEVTPGPIAAAVTAVTSSMNPSTYNIGVTFTATVASGSGTGAAPVGTVTFMDGATAMGTKALSNGTASFKANYATYTLPPGSDAITAVYHGDANYSASTSASLTQIVTDPTTTVISSSPNPSVYGQPVIFSVTVTSGLGPPPNGEIVTFKRPEGSAIMGTAALSGGAATFSYSAFAVGNSAVKAFYGGDSLLKPSGSETLLSTGTVINQPLNQVVQKATTTTALVSSQNSSSYEQPVTFTATVSPQYIGVPAGSVTFYNGPTMIGVAILSNGVAAYTTTRLAVGTATITAEYKGDNSFQISTSAPLSQVVNAAATTTTLASSLNPSNSGQSVTFTAKVAAQFGGTVTGSVAFTDGTTTLATANLSGGVARFTTKTLASGAHDITASYNGSTNFAVSSAGLTQTVN
jgi:uncharacterized repeat protein (TIGR03803 family)